MNSFWRVVRLLPEYRYRVAKVAVLSALVGCLGAAGPYIYKRVVDIVAQVLRGSVASDRASRTIAVLIALFAVVRVTLVLGGVGQRRLSQDLFVDSIGSLRATILKKMTGQPIDYYEKTRVGEIMDRYGAGVAAISWWIHALAEGALASILQSVFFIGILLSKSPVVGVVMALVMLLNIRDSYAKVVAGQPYNRGWLTFNGKMSGLLSEMFSNISTVRSLGGEVALQRRYAEYQGRWLEQRDKLYAVNATSELRCSIINSLAIFFAVGFVSWGALNHRYGPGDILLVLMLSQSLLVAIDPITRLINQAGEVEVSAERLLTLIEIESPVTDIEGAVALTEIRSLEFENVSFTYPGKTEPVLRDVSFSLASGDTLALVGPSGSGKTTIIKLLLRFYEPGQGRILVNGTDIRRFTQESVRALTGVVLQDVTLFNDTIEENIAFARSKALPDDIRAAARAANAHSFIDRLASGYETIVGERGLKLSGGEKQRVAIARALLKNPQLIILDEATSALDSESERLVQSGLGELMRGRTSVVIAHRLSTIVDADEIVVLKEGRVVESGDHATLLRSSGVYARLHELQHDASAAG